MERKWTKAQQQVISLRNRNLLVSAAAGSGKTAVLVERIIGMLTDEEAPLQVDQLLIVTFTEAAAAEMKERIQGAIEKKLGQEPGNAHLQQQSALLHHALITTIHSFCLNVIREHFHTIDLDPGFRIVEEGELKLLKQDVMAELLENYYSMPDNTAFLEFVDKIGTGRDDSKIEEIILKLYEYAISYPQPEKWLDDCVRNYQVYQIEEGNPANHPSVQKGEGNPANHPLVQKKEDNPANHPLVQREEGNPANHPLVQKKEDNLANHPLVQKIEGIARRRLGYVVELLAQGIDVCGEADGPIKYIENLEKEQESVLQAIGADSFVALQKAVREIQFGRLPAIKKTDEMICASKKEQVSKLRNQAKEIVKELREDYFYGPLTTIFQSMARTLPTAQMLVELVKEFSRLLSITKRSKNLVDFSDMEHLALAILTEEKDGKLMPSKVAYDYQAQFAQVMIDEYQDSNLTQEAILTGVSTVGQGKYNIFMVGDVKQSIYSFRLARPDLFMEKFHTYTKVEETPAEDSSSKAKVMLADVIKTQRIDLHKNFRSRSEVLSGVNHIFRQIMRPEIGGVAYDEDAALHPGAAYPAYPPHMAESPNKIELLLCEGSKESEARAVAWRIKELLRTGIIYDKRQESFRPVRYRDIVILAGVMKGWGDLLASALAKANIPAYTGSREGYFATYEIGVLLDYLRIIDNPRQDIPLSSVLASPFVGLSAIEMAQIKSRYPKEPFYLAVQLWVEEDRHKLSKDESQGEADEQRQTEEVAKEQLEMERHGDAKQTAVELEEDKEREQEIRKEERQAQERGRKQEEVIDISISRKLMTFWQEMNHYREMIPYMGVHDLLWRLIEETGFGLYMQAMPGGNQRKANIDMLVEKAAIYEGTSYKGVFHFIRYIELLKKYEVEYGEANLIDEQADTVRIMSIHKSKGLEFPIVFLTGMNKGFTNQEAQGSLAIHPILGFGLDDIDLERRTISTTLMKKLIKEESRLESLGEKLRILYVALTRAEEKLIMVGQYKAGEEKFNELRERLTSVSLSGSASTDASATDSSATGSSATGSSATDSSATGSSAIGSSATGSSAIGSYLIGGGLSLDLSLVDIDGSKNYLDLVLPIVLRDKRQELFTCTFLSDPLLAEKEEITALREEITKDVLEHFDTKRVYHSDMAKQLQEQLSFLYPFADESQMKLKFTVSELKKRRSLAEEAGEELYQEPVVVPLLPRFVAEEAALSGAGRGTAYHRVLEFLDFSKEYTKEILQTEIQELHDYGKLSKEEKASIRPEDILALLHSSLGERLRRATLEEQLHQEQPFVMAVDAAEIYPVEVGQEQILVQGIIDLYFEEEGELVVLDYKTDRVNSSAELKNKYQMQLDYYAKALERLTEKKVKERLIYSFALGEEVRL